jgi:hypothetical protein
VCVQKIISLTLVNLLLLLCELFTNATIVLPSVIYIIKMFT